MSPLTNALISYWHRLPSESPAARRKALDATRDRIRAGLETPAALVPFALGDVDDSIVIAATREYVAAAVHGKGATDDAIVEVADWVRRGLALNRGAVFGALLGSGDERFEHRLAGLRLTLSPSEVETACRVVGPAAGRVAAFVQDWLALLEEGAPQRECRALAGALEAGPGARAA
jgi:hypothetical protein